MKTSQKGTLFAATLLASSALAVSANAQSNDDIQLVPVLDQKKRAYSTEGYGVQAFNVQPSASQAFIYDSNIFAEDDTGATDEDADIISRTDVAVQARSRFARHSLSADAAVRFNEYFENGNESHQNYTVGAKGTLDVAAGTKVTGEARFAQKHEDRRSPDSTATSIKPTQFNQTDLTVGFERSAGRVGVKVSADMTELDFADGISTTGTKVENDDRDRTEMVYGGELSYTAPADLQFYTAGNFTAIDYDVEGGVADRDSDGYEVRIGARKRISNRLRTEGYVGYLRRDFDGSGLETVDTPTFGFNMLSMLTSRTSVEFDIERTIQETTLTNLSANVSTRYTVKAQHAIQDNMVATADVQLRNDEYEGNGIPDREDDYVLTGVGVEYFINNRWSAGVNYGYDTRESSVAGNDFGRHQIFAGLTARF